MANENGICGLSGNALKIIAAISMLIDHIGVILLPGVTVLRIIGRIAFPIYAYMIAEGCFYTRNKLRYFLSIFTLGIGCQLVYSLYDGGKLFGILITFSLSIIIVYALQHMYKALASESVKTFLKILSVLIFAAAVFGVYLLNEIFLIDYGFLGCLAPVFVSIFKIPGKKAANQRSWERPLQVISLGVCLLCLVFTMGSRQLYALLALPLLLLYSGRRGKLKMKYFFYVFYPLHLAILQGISSLFK